MSLSVNTKIKLLVVDLDQTLTSHNNKISDENLWFITQLQKEGIRVVVATGRGLESSLPICQQLQVDLYDSPIVCLNGGIVYDMQRQLLLSTKLLSDEMVNEILTLKTEGTIFIDQKQQHYCLQKTSLIQKFETFYDETIQLISKENLITKKIVSGFVLGKNLKVVNKIVNQVQNAQIKFASSFDWAVQFSATSKGEAVQKLVQKWRISNQEILAIGDNLNDLELIQWVKYGVAVANAVPELKAVAYDITDHWDQDGVAKAIKKYFYNL